MGFLDSFLGADGEREPVFPGKGDATPFRISMSFVPLRLSAMKANKVDLVMKVTNSSAKKHLVSVDVFLPGNRLVGFDRTCINKAVEKKIGELHPGQTIEVAVPVWGSNQTKEGEIPLEITAYSHYLDYDKVLAHMKTRAVLRIV